MTATIITDAINAIDWVKEAGRRMAEATDRVTQLEDERAPIKAQAIRRLMLLTNESTGKAHSASSAEAVVELDAEYAGYRKQQRAAEVERHRSEAAYAAAKLGARLQVALVEAAGGGV